jgi:uncharacterized membrane protein YjjP (DUF1212 family)
VAEPMTREENARVLALVMQAGRILLENGAEVFRVQETMTIMAESYGLQNFNAYVLTNALFASADGVGISAVRDVPRRTVHLGRVDAVNELSREAAAGGLSLDEAERRMDAAEKLPFPSARAQILSSALGSFCFAFLFGGGLPEGSIALAAGAILGWYLLKCEQVRISNLLRRITGAALITIVCLICSILVTGSNPSPAIIGTLMILTPGVAMTMGVRDFLRADYLSGTIRLIDALLIAGSIAAGTGMVLGMYGWLTGVSV